MSKPYEAKNFDHLLGTEGFSETLLKNHFTLYQGYVTNTNKVLDELSELSKAGKTASPQFAELKRRLGWEFNGMRLHEIYFGNMKKGGAALSSGSSFEKKIKEEFGSLEEWRKDFTATGAMRGIGWAALYSDRVSGRLFNFWINEHDAGHPGGQKLLLIMDVFEHAFLTDYGLKRPAYIEAFFKSIDWTAAQSRFDDPAF